MALNEPRWHPAAVLDAESARNWYARHSPFAPRGFLLALDAAVQAVMDAPQRQSAKSDGCRHHVFPSRYPFTLVYRLVPDVQIVAVAHHRRKPGYWQGR